MITPTYTFNVDLTNPGQLFACCGLLELANAVDGESLGWFEANQFHIAGAAANETLVKRFLKCDIASLSQPSIRSQKAEDKEAVDKLPLWLGEPFRMQLHWWNDSTADRAGFKTWSGGQTAISFLTKMRLRVAQAPCPEVELLISAYPIASPKPFSFDSRLYVMTSLDLGFSPENETATFSPAAEALAFIGLQRFRPQTIKLRASYAYSTWRYPLPAAIAAAVTAGLAPTLANEVYKFPLIVRTGDKYKAFGPAQF